MHFEKLFRRDISIRRQSKRSFCFDEMAPFFSSSNLNRKMKGFYERTTSELHLLAILWINSNDKTLNRQKGSNVPALVSFAKNLGENQFVGVHHFHFRDSVHTTRICLEEFQLYLEYRHHDYGNLNNMKHSSRD